MTRWVIGRCRANHEIEVADRLIKEGREVYCPRYDKKIRVKRWQRNPRTTITKAVFKSYVFIDEGTLGNVEEVESIPKFYHLLRTHEEGRLWTLPGAWIDDLRSLEGKGLLVPTLASGLVRRFEAYEAVKVVEGVFMGYGAVVKSEAKGRVWAWVGDRKLPVEFDAASLEPAT